MDFSTILYQRHQTMASQISKNVKSGDRDSYETGPILHVDSWYNHSLGIPYPTHHVLELKCAEIPSCWIFKHVLPLRVYGKAWPIRIGSLLNMIQMMA
ncbi:hypothetical protein HNY73_006199 [Argiope bruennichi]|uniref:Uncharacterized protein n=1 Tax=Argiope bruennichi TaxID=94029 RepID=A0A8T0FLF0_ARGBR|nr:hypothetical protein HNY73_006199 [Argiope bruennichi]